MKKKKSITTLYCNKCVKKHDINVTKCSKCGCEEFTSRTTKI